MVNQEFDKGFLPEERSDEGSFFGVRRLAAAFLAAATATRSAQNYPHGRTVIWVSSFTEH